MNECPDSTQISGSVGQGVGMALTASVGWGQQASKQRAGLGRGKSQASAQVQQQSWRSEALGFLQGELQSVQQPWA